MSPEAAPDQNPPVQPYQPEQNATYAGYLGLADGQFVVERSSGERETGWQIAGQAITRYADGTAAEAVMITKAIDDGTVLEKTVPLDTLYGWQRQADQEQESSWEKHYEYIFSPILRPESAMEHPGYDYLFTDDTAAQEQAATYHEAQRKVSEAQQEHDKFVTPAARRLAVDTLMQVSSTDTELTGIINSFGSKIDLSDTSAIVDALRTYPDLRVAVGKHYVRKVNKAVQEHWSEMPDRIRDNTEKSISGPASKRIAKLSSREYVALLCLSRIDGTFNPMQEDTGTEYDGQGRAIVGQHRDAAEMVLSEPA